MAAVKYSCHSGYRLYQPAHNILFCIEKEWVGTRPKCIADGSEGVDEEREDELNQEYDIDQEEEFCEVSFVTICTILKIYKDIIMLMCEVGDIGLSPKFYNNVFGSWKENKVIP